MHVCVKGSYMLHSIYYQNCLYFIHSHMFHLILLSHSLTLSSSYFLSASLFRFLISYSMPHIYIPIINLAFYIHSLTYLFIFFLASSHHICNTKILFFNKIYSDPYNNFLKVFANQELIAAHLF